MEANLRRVQELERQLSLTRAALVVVFALFGGMAALAMWSAQQTVTIAGEALSLASECEARRAAMAVAIGRYDEMLVAQMQEHEVALAHLQQCVRFGP